MADYIYQMTHKFKDKSRMDAAEDWLRANVRGAWTFEFLGIATEGDATLYHVRYLFERGEEIQRFRDEFLAARKAATTTPGTKPGKAKKGLLARLLG